MKALFTFVSSQVNHSMSTSRFSWMLLGLVATLAACDDDGSASEEGPQVHVPDHYSFDSRFLEGSSSVSYSGQIHRHLLVHDLKAAIGGLTARVDEGWTPEAGEVAAELGFYFDFDGEVAADVEHGFTGMDVVQTTYGEVASKNLVGKIAGNDEAGQHVDWSTAFVGWSAEGVTTPESLVRHFFGEIERLTIARANGEPALDPSGAAIGEAFVSAEGVDYQQLTQKFIDGAVAFSQATDDYLDDDLEGHGILSDNGGPRAEGKPDTALEHGWDEAFGYFGAARDYGDYTDDEIAGKGGRDGWTEGFHDADEDGLIDLTAEVNWGHSVNAAKRDRGSHAEAPTDFSEDAWHAFCAGRSVITEAGGPLSEAQLDQLRGHRDAAVGAWEKAISATIVHYINEVLVDMVATEYDFAGHAKHWSELKGFALALQFNPRSPVSDADFERLHALLGQAPVLPGGDVEGYAAKLLEARGILGDAYGFDALNLGDSAGENGW